MSAVLDEQKAAIASLEEMMKEAPAEQFAKIGDSRNARLLLAIALRVLSVLEDLNACPQGCSSTVQGMFQMVEPAKSELHHLGSEEMFHELFEHVPKPAEDGKVHSVEASRYRRRPARYPKGRINMEVMRRYKDVDFNQVMSRVRLLHEEHSDPSSVDGVAEIIRNMHEATRQYFKEVESLLRIILVMPASFRDAERSFSALRRLKTWLRNTMGETRLSYVTLAHVHQDIDDRIEIA
ncbi:hypothetical protein HPB50_021597 [Hyalomma asiaticum]|uniref:Uncharacterized protein n=1 Tax=Hyalomma asiaticum TaxID=266040 RepID=A0ACB7TNY1_HYAAI|nr:hypothetical protein HPB50_021597 [Hyalomma asiaticum]